MSHLRITWFLLASLFLSSFTVSAHGQTIPAHSDSASPTWSAIDVANESDGTARVLWDRSDGAWGLWSMGASDAVTDYGPIYGPYPGWTAMAISAAPNGKTVMLVTNSDGAAGLWTFGQTNAENIIGSAYGPYADSSGTWTASGMATAPDGTSRILWTRSDGAAGLWTMNADDTVADIGPTYGPYADSSGSWTARGVGVAQDDTARILWDRTDGAAGIWAMSITNVVTTIGPVYTNSGPVYMLPVAPSKPSAHPESMTGGVYKHHLGVFTDGTSRILWTHSDGSENIVTYDATGTQTMVGETYGPFTDFTATALGAGGDGSRCLWVRSDRAAGLWSYAADNSNTVIGALYGPF